jgi:VWFA-related protein
VFTNRLPAQPGAPSGVTIILFDARNTAFKDQPYAKAQVIRYLHTLQPSDHIGVYEFDNALRVIHDYTSDSSPLLEKLDASKDWSPPGIPEPRTNNTNSALNRDSAIFDGLVKDAGGTSGAERDFFTIDTWMATLRAFDFICEHLARLPGRKNLIWVSGGFLPVFEFNFSRVTGARASVIDELDHALRAMNEANIAIYPVDARGLMVDSRFSAEHRRISNAPAGLPLAVKNGLTTMDYVASNTGGLAFHDTNGIADAIHAAVSDSDVSYTIGFYAANSDFDGQFHKIDVETPQRPGLKLRYRRGYYDTAEKVENARTHKAELSDAVWSPIDATAIGITATVKPSPDNPATMDVDMKIDHSSISLSQEEGRWRGRLNVLFVQRNDQGKEYGEIDDTVDLDITKPRYDRLVAEDLIYHRVIDRAVTARLLRVVVRDVPSGAIGSITVPLDAVK